MTEERIQKVLAHLGLGSRRAIEDWIEDGRVKINGAMARLGDRVGPRDEVRVDGRPVGSATAAPRQQPAGFYNKESQYQAAGNIYQPNTGNHQPGSYQPPSANYRGAAARPNRNAPQQQQQQQPVGLYGRGLKEPRNNANASGGPLGDYRRAPRRVLVYYKPEGEVCTRTDPEGRPTVFDRLPKLENERWVVVGRLDIATTGLLLFTTDGDLANSLMHPSSQVQREYAARVYGDITQESLNNLLTGVALEDGIAKFSQIVDAGGDGKNHWYHVTIGEGKNREIRRMFESQGLQVSRLIRIRFGHIKLQRDWRPGQYQELVGDQVEQLSQQVGITLKRRTGLYGRSKVRAEKITPTSKSEPNGHAEGDDTARRGGYLRRRRHDSSAI